MDQFIDRNHVRLRSRELGTYLHAADDGERSVILSRCRASLNTAWAVHVYEDRDGRRYLLLHSAAYDRYLANTAAPAPPGHRGFRTKQRDYDQPGEAIMWQVSRAGDQGDVRLRNVGVGGLYLRANGKFLCWNTRASVHRNIASTMTRWVVEQIPRRESAPPLPPPIPIRVRGLLSGFLFGQEPEAWRTIRFYTVNGFSPPGYYPENGWLSFAFYGRSVVHLSNELDIRIGANGRPVPRLRHALSSGDLPEDDNDDFVMCVRAGRYGRLTPLVVDLPHGGYDETLEIIVMLSGTAEYDALRHPDVDAA